MRTREPLLPMVAETGRQVVALTVYVGATLFALSTAFLPLLTLGVRGWGNLAWWCVIWIGFLLPVIRWGTRVWCAAPLAAGTLPVWPISQFIANDRSWLRW